MMIPTSYLLRWLLIPSSVVTLLLYFYLIPFYFIAFIIVIAVVFTYCFLLLLFDHLLWCTLVWSWVVVKDSINKEHLHLSSLPNAASVGEGHLKAGSDGGDCNVDPTEAAGTGRLKNSPSCGLDTIPISHWVGVLWTRHQWWPSVLFKVHETCNCMDCCWKKNGWICHHLTFINNFVNFTDV